MHAIEKKWECVEREREKKNWKVESQPTTYYTYTCIKSKHPNCDAKNGSQKKTFVIPHLKQKKMFMNYFFFSRCQAYEWSLTWFWSFASIVFYSKKKEKTRWVGELYSLFKCTECFAVLLCIVYIISILCKSLCLSNINNEKKKKKKKNKSRLTFQNTHFV